MAAVKAKEGIYYVGALDKDLRVFDIVMYSDYGTTYNAYLVKGAAKTALIDTVKAPYVETLKQHIAALCELASVDYIVCNHAEPDHAGGLPEMVKACPNATVVCKAKCKDALEHHFDTTAWKWQVVKEGETLDLGGRTLPFFDTVMCHWPESMVTYLQEEECRIDKGDFQKDEDAAVK